MDYIFGSKIKALRLQNTLTQAELAEALGISTPAVSKWERGLSMPDITLLAPLARCLGTTIDELLSFNARLTEDEALRIREKCEKAFAAGLQDGMDMCEEYLRQYPGDPKLAFLLAAAIHKNLLLAPNEETAEEMLALVIKLNETATAEKGEYGQAAEGMLINLYAMNGQLDKAEAMARELPDGMFSKNKSLVPVLKMQGKSDEAQKLEQQVLFYALHDASLAVTGLAAYEYGLGNYEKAIEMYEKLAQAAKLFQTESFGVFSNTMFFLAAAYAKCGEEEKALACVEEFAEVLPKFAKLNVDNTLFFDRLEMKKEETGAERLREIWKDELQKHEAFANIKKTPGFCAALRKLGE